MALNFNYRGGSSSSTGSGVQYCVGGVPKIPLAHFKAASTSPPRPGACAKKRQHVASTTGHPSPPPPPPPLQGDATKTDPHGAAAVGGARDGSTSSTPHAPRRKKLLGSSSSLLLAGGGGGGGGGGLGQQRSFLDSSLIEKAVMGKEGGTWGVAHAQDRKEAWHTSAPSEKKMVRPFRRTRGRKAPEGIPQLQLYSLNEPDQDMELVQLMPSQKSSSLETISWGLHLPLVRTRERRQVGPPATDELVVQDIALSPRGGEEGGREGERGMEEVMEVMKEEDDDTHDQQQWASHFDFVERKVLSHERDRQGSPPHPPHPPSLPPPPPPPPVPGGPSAALMHKMEGLQSSIVFGSRSRDGGGNAKSRVRFEARVLTQNGRDIHRELYGFFFLADNSIAIYEYRQFGQRCSALPLIHRGVYRQVLGRKAGEPYHIHHIRKGATLHFSTSTIPSLPDTMASRSLLSIRITQVDERSKREMLCEGRQPKEQRQVVEELLAGGSPPGKENSLLQTLQGLLRNRLRGRASKTLVNLGRHLCEVSVGKKGGGGGGASCHGDDGVVSKTQLQQALRVYHISLTNEDFEQLWRLVQCSGVCEGDGVCVNGCIAFLIGEMKEERKALIRKVFRKLDAHREGTAHLNEMRKFFNASRHPDVVEARCTAEEVHFNLFNCLSSSSKRSEVSYAEFENYYEGVSIETQSDSAFYSTVKSCWSI